MSVFDVLKVIGGVAFIMLGMQVMSNALEKKAGGKLKVVLSSMTEKPVMGFLLGIIVTAVVQSSTATTVMTVGFVNSGLMTLHQAIFIIMGANLGTTVTSWILSLTGLSSGNFWLQLLKPSSFVPVLALIASILCVFVKNPKKKDTGLILFGFSVLMTGMQTLTDVLSNLPTEGMAKFLVLFSNPVFGVLAGALVAAIVHSSAASVGILQALSATGAISFGTAIPIIMGQNIGTCVTAVMSSFGANKNAKRTACVHLYFNLIGTIVILVLFYAINAVVHFSFFKENINGTGIAVVHTAFNILCTLIWLPFTRLLEKLAMVTVRDNAETEKYEMLDERLMATPSIAVQRCQTVAESMAEIAVDAIKKSFALLGNYNEKDAEEILKYEDKVDQYEDRLGSYLVKLSALELSSDDSKDATKLLHLIGDFERISDHAVNILRSAEEIEEKKLNFSGNAKRELGVVFNAVSEIVDLAYHSFVNNDLDSAFMVEPLEQVVDYLKDLLKKQHVSRLQKGECTIELGFVLTDLLTSLERVSDHCSNIAGCLLEMSHDDMDIHEYLRGVKDGEKKEFNDYYDYFKMKYALETA